MQFQWCSDSDLELTITIVALVIMYLGTVL